MIIRKVCKVLVTEINLYFLCVYNYLVSNLKKEVSVKIVKFCFISCIVSFLHEIPTKHGYTVT